MSDLSTRLRARIVTSIDPDTGLPLVQPDGSVIEAADELDRMQAEQPQWRVRPTEPGRWWQESPSGKRNSRLIHELNEGWEEYITATQGQYRWYGPIPPDPEAKQ